MISLVGLEDFSNLTNLNIPGNRISDISALQTLTELIYLPIQNNNISCADIDLLESLIDAAITDDCDYY